MMNYFAFRYRWSSLRYDCIVIVRNRSRVLILDVLSLIVAPHQGRTWWHPFSEPSIHHRGNISGPMISSRESSRINHGDANFEVVRLLLEYVEARGFDILRSCTNCWLVAANHLLDCRFFRKGRRTVGKSLVKAWYWGLSQNNGGIALLCNPAANSVTAFSFSPHLCLPSSSFFSQYPRFMWKKVVPPTSMIPLVH